MWSTIAVVLSLAALEVAEPQSKGDPAADLLEVFATGLANGDARAVYNSLAPNVTVFWVEGTFRGRQEMMDYLAGQTRIYSSVQFSVNDIQPATSRTVSVVWGEGELNMAGRGIAPGVSVQGRYSAVAQKLKTGWALTNIHFSVSYPPAYNSPPK